MGDIPDTGLFRPFCRDYEADPSEVLTSVSNRVWNSQLERSVRRQALEATPEQRAVLEGVEAQTRKELSKGATCEGHIIRLT